MSELLLPAAVLIGAAIASVFLRRWPRVLSAVSIAALVIGFAAVTALTVSQEDRVADVTLRMTGVARLVDEALIALLIIVALFVALVEPLPNFHPAALFVAGATHLLLVTTQALPLFVVLVGALIAPVVAFVFRPRETRSLEAAVRYFGAVSVGASLGIAALGLAAQQPAAPGEEHAPLTLLLVVLIATFALLLGAVPFHVHLASLTSDAPIASLALLFGVLLPLTFVAFPLLLIQSRVLPAVASVEKAQVALSALGSLSALGGALLAVGAPDLRRLIAYSVLSNVGAALVGVATFSAAGLVGAIGTMLVTAAAATQQLLSAGALERARLPGDQGWSARRAPLASVAFLLSSLALVGLPPMGGFPPRFLLQEIAFAVTAPLGAALLVASLGLIVAHVRAGLGLFAQGVSREEIERRPVAGATGLVIVVALLAVGIYPNAYLPPIVDFAREFLLALRPF
ncbi:MAG TPA: proton-conducting transporter membrane subunit [Candidatus Dormibacteraeota bacterium]|nr:proton-conducting transporter membrane subunit [Candidatus Dormibacteraeota bacterium]